MPAIEDIDWDVLPDAGKGSSAPSSTPPNEINWDVLPDAATSSPEEASTKLSRPPVKLPDGSVGTVKSIGVGDDRGEWVIPTIVNGKPVSNKEAIRLWKQGKNEAIGGPFKTVEESNDYAQKFHLEEEKRLSSQSSKTAADIDWDVLPDDVRSSPTFLGELGKGIVEPFKSLVKSPKLAVLSDDDLGKILQREWAKQRSTAPGTIASKTGGVIGGVIGGVGEFAGAEAGGTALAAETGPAAPFIGLGAAAAAFGASGAYESFVSAGTKALAEGKPMKEALDIAKKLSKIGGAIGAVTAAALPGVVSGAIKRSAGLAATEAAAPLTAAALKETGETVLKTAAGGAAVGAGGKLTENIAEQETGLKTEPMEGVAEQAAIMGALPVTLHGIQKWKLSSAEGGTQATRIIKATRKTPTGHVSIEGPANVVESIISKTTTEEEPPAESSVETPPPKPPSTGPAGEAVEPTTKPNVGAAAFPTLDETELEQLADLADLEVEKLERGKAPMDRMGLATQPFGKKLGVADLGSLMEGFKDPAGLAKAARATIESRKPKPQPKEPDASPIQGDKGSAATTGLQPEESQAERSPDLQSQPPGTPNAPPPPQAEKIVSAAYRDENGTVHTGANHPEILKRLGIEGFDTRESRNTEQFGFVTSDGRFVTRPEAAPIIEKSGQKLDEFDVDEKGQPQPHSDEVASPTQPEKPLGDVPQGTDEIGPTPTADQLIGMTPEQFTAWKKRVLLDRKTTKGIAETLKPEDVARLESERAKLSAKTSEINTDIEKNGYTDAKFKAQGEASVKAQTLREILEDYAEREKAAKEGAAGKETRKLNRDFGTFPKGTEVKLTGKKTGFAESEVEVEFPDGTKRSFPTAWLSKAEAAPLGNLPNLLQTHGRQRLSELISEWDQNARLSPDGTSITSPTDPRNQTGKSRASTKEFLTWLQSDEGQAALNRPIPPSGATPEQSAVDQLHKEADEARAKVRKEYPPIHKKIVEASGLSRRELDALLIPDPSEVQHPSEVQNIPKDLAANAPGGRMNNLYNLLASETSRGKFFWGGTADKPEIGFEPDVSGGKPDAAAAQKALKAVDAIRGVFGFDPLPDFFKLQDKRVETGNPHEILGQASHVKVTVPEGATQIRVTDKQGRTSIQSLANINKGENPFRGVDVAKVESGTIGRDKGFVPIKGDVGVADKTPAGPGTGEGPGTPPAGFQTKAQIEQLTDAFKGIAAKKAPLSQQVKEAFSVGDRLSTAKDAIGKALSALKASGDFLRRKFEGVNTVDEMLRAKGELSKEIEARGWRVRQWVRQAAKAVPSRRDQAAIAKWIDAGGDAAELRRGMAETKPQFRQAYQDALNLKGDLLKAAQDSRAYHEARLDEAIDAGVLKDGVEDYLHRIYESRPGLAAKAIAYVQTGLLKTNQALTKKRVFQFDWEAEKLGYKPVQSFIPRIAQYESSLSRAIAAREFIKKATTMKAADGRPVIDVKGVGIPIEDPSGVREGTLIKPQFNPARQNQPGTAAYRGDYVNKEFPALSKWKWVSEDAAGKPIYVQGDVAIHPDYVNRVAALLEPSRVKTGRFGTVLRPALKASSVFKQTMLDLSGFHQVQIAVHAMEHKVNPFNLVQDIDFDHPDVDGLLKGGVTLGGDYYAKEGLVGASLTRQIPMLGPLVESYHSWLFQDFIPRIKMTMALKALERNRERYAGTLNEEQIFNKTAMQANSAFGELNYTLLERSATARDMARLIMLAPDFLEARGRFAAEAFSKGGKNFGNEQRSALLLGALTMYVAARVANKVSDDQWHFEPENMFSLVHNGRAYGLRTVQGDILHLVSNPLSFWMHRLNPVFGRTALEAMTSRDEFGRKRSVADQMWDAVSNIRPIALRSSRERTIWESLANSFGITDRRWQDTDKAFEMARSWKSKHGIGDRGEFIYDADKDPLRPLKVSLSRNDDAAAAKEIKKLVDGKTYTLEKLTRYFDRYSNLAFTGSKANDQKWLATLSEDEKKTVEAARQHKIQIRDLYRKARGKYRAAALGELEPAD